MKAEDLEHVWEIEKLSFSLPWSIESLRLEVKENQCAKYYVIKLDDRLVAYAGMWIVLDEAHITNIAVHPDYRGKGFGRMILKTLIGVAKGIGMERMTLEVRVSNTPAINLYTKYGFFAVGKRPNYYVKPVEDALIMWKQID